MYVNRREYRNYPRNLYKRMNYQSIMANGMKQIVERKESPDYEYQIYVDGKLVWHGLNPEKIYEKIIKENPNKKVALAWELKEGILIAFI